MSKTSLLAKTKTELLRMARRLGLRGITTLTKATLADEIQHAKRKKASAAAKTPVGVAAVARRMAVNLKRRAVRKRVRLAAVPKTKRPSRPPRPTPATAKATPRRSVPAIPVAAPNAEISAHKFDVTPSAQPTPVQVFREEYLGELPESYGTGRLFLAARDPHWLYAYWDLSRQQMADARGQASDGRLILRVLEKNHAKPVQELALQHDSRDWYVPVNKAATTYVAELGYWRHDGHYHVISRSKEVTTPSDTVSADSAARFVTIPMDISFRDLLGLIRSHMNDGERLADVLHRLQSAGFRFPFKVGMELGPWTAEQAAELERLLGGDILRRIQMGSFEISEWLRRRLMEQLGSAMFSAFSPGGASWPGGQPEKGFWFAVNAELIIYGATEPNAKVTVDGKPVKLQSDGTFSFHYAFPDGQYRLPVVAVAAAGDDKRAVELTFERKTAAKGEVGRIRQPARLKSPVAA